MKPVHMTKFVYGPSLGIASGQSGAEGRDEVGHNEAGVDDSIH